MKTKIYVISITLCLWLGLTILSDGELPFIYPVVSEFTSNFSKIITYSLASAMRIVVSLIISLGLGVTIGLIMVERSKADVILNPLINSWYPIPKATLTPIFIIVFGLGEFSKISLLVCVTIFPIIIAVRGKILNFPSEYKRLIRIYNIKGHDLLLKVYLKGCIKDIIITIKVVIGIAVAVLYLSESSFGASLGLGYYISRNMGVNQAGVVVGIIMLSAIGLGLFKLVDLLEQKFIKW